MQKKFACITCYDATFAKVAEEAGIDLILIGDSLGMVIKGEASTINVSTDEIVYHTRAVANVKPHCFLMADMPFMEARTLESGLNSAMKIMQAGAQMIKIEGGAWIAPLVQSLKKQGVPVCVHLGLTPQSIHSLGGFKLQAREAQEADVLINDAQALESAGADIILVECIPAQVTERLYSTVSIPVIGIGAGPSVDGQILVLHDLLGIPSGFKPRFAKNYLAQTNSIQKALVNFKEDIQSGAYPSAQHYS